MPIGCAFVTFPFKTLPGGMRTLPSTIAGAISTASTGMASFAVTEESGCKSRTTSRDPAGTPTTLVSDARGQFSCAPLSSFVIIKSPLVHHRPVERWLVMFDYDC